MTLKKIIIVLLLLLIAAPVLNAQIHGLSVTNTAEPAEKGLMQIMGCAVKSENSTLLGGRFAYRLSSRILLSFDLGTYDTEYASAETMGQFGVLYSLPLDLPFDLAVRSTLIPYVASYEHYVEFTFSLLASRYLDSNSNWAIYGSIGTDYQKWELILALDPVLAAYLGQDTYVDKGDQTDAAFSIGITRRLFSKARLFVEAAHIKDFYGGTGIRFDL